MADVKAVVEAKTLEEMPGDLKKRALVDTGLHANKSRGRDTFDSDLKAQSFADTLLTSWKRIKLRYLAHMHSTECGGRGGAETLLDTLADTLTKAKGNKREHTGQCEG